jgi:hypothetical protein
MQSLLITSLALFTIAPRALDEHEIKFSDCPAAVRNSLLAEAKQAKIETVTKETGEDEPTVYWAEVKVDGRLYAIGVLENGSLSEMNLAVDEEDIALAACPAAVQTTFRAESFGEKVNSVGKDIKYGVTIYETVVAHDGKSYEVVVSEDGTLVEKGLVIDDQEIKLTECPEPVKKSLREHAKGGTIGNVTRFTGIGHPTFEAEVTIEDTVYLIEVSENGHLISKSLEAAEE